MNFEFSNILIAWYLRNKRDLPWRNTKDPYLIWVSEVILQQTRIDQGLSYYENLTSLFPDVKSMANADVDFLLKQWQGLGYYNRAHNMHQSAKYIANECAGEFPSTYLEIIALKGVGDYIAAAIASFAFDLPHAVCDGNVKRVISRYFAIQKPVDKPEGAADLLIALNSVFDGGRAALFNQAIMDFGSMVCVKHNPNCSNCPMMSGCAAFKDDLVNVLPVKSLKTKVSNRYIHYLIIKTSNNVYVRRRGRKDIWANMYDFPDIESDKIMDVAALIQTPEWARLFGSIDVQVNKVSAVLKHQLSHQRIHACFIEVCITEPLKNFEKVDATQFDALAIPRLVDKFIQGNPIF